MTNTNTKQEGKEGIKEASEVLNLFTTKTAKLYWIKAMVKQGILNTVQAGILTIKQGLI